MSISREDLDIKRGKLFGFPEPKTLDEILLEEQIAKPKKCILLSSKARGDFFIPWYRDPHGYWVGIIRYYGKSPNKTIDAMDGKRKVWEDLEVITIRSENHSLIKKLNKD